MPRRRPCVWVDLTLGFLGSRGRDVIIHGAITRVLGDVHFYALDLAQVVLDRFPFMLCGELTGSMVVQPLKHLQRAVRVTFLSNLSKLRTSVTRMSRLEDFAVRVCDLVVQAFSPHLFWGLSARPWHVFGNLREKVPPRGLLVPDVHKSAIHWAFPQRY